MAVRKLATALKKAKKQGQVNAFIQVDLKECAWHMDVRACGMYVLICVQVAASALRKSKGDHARWRRERGYVKGALGSANVDDGMGSLRLGRGRIGSGLISVDFDHSHCGMW